MPKNLKTQLKELQDQHDAVLAILNHVAPDIDLDSELNDVAMKPDGTLVYIGELAAPAGDTEDTTEDAEHTPEQPQDETDTEHGDDEDDETTNESNQPTVFKFRRPSPARSRGGTASTKPDVAAMIESARNINAGVGI